MKWQPTRRQKSTATVAAFQTYEHARHTYTQFFKVSTKKERCIEKKGTAGFVGSFGHHKETSPPHEGDDDAPLQRKKPSERLKVSNRLSLFQIQSIHLKGVWRVHTSFFFSVRRNKKLLHFMCKTIICLSDCHF